MSLATIRAAIVATLGSVPGIGRVHDYERFAAQEAAFRELYLAEGRLHGWNVRRIRSREIASGLHSHIAVDGWRIDGYFGLEDATASGKAFDDEIEAIRDAFRLDQTLGGLVADTCDITDDAQDKPTGIQVEQVQPVMFAGKLCHAARLGLITSNVFTF